MTRRIILIGSAAVAALWAPYIYAELARKPVPAASEASRADLSEPTQLDVRPTPALFVAPVEEGRPAEEVAEEPPPPPAAAEEAHDPSAAEAHADEPEHAPPAPGAPNPMVAAAHDLPPQTVAEPSEPGEAKPAASAGPGEAKPAAEGSVAQPPAEATAAAAPVPENETRAAAVARGSAFREVFERESRDPAWAVAEEPRVSELLRVAGTPTQEVRCQRTVCRIAISAGTELADDSEAFRRLRSEFGAGVAIARGAAETDPLAVFILRPGFKLE